MNGYISQLIAEDHIAELRAQAARRRLRSQAVQAAASRPSRRSTAWPMRLRLDAGSARRAQPLRVASGARVTTVRVRPSAEC